MQAVADLSPTTAVIGCGNANRSDDGIGSFVIGLLRERQLGEEVALFDGGTDGMGVMYRARGVSRLIIVDARVPSGNPGAIYEVPGRALEAQPQQSLNLHDFRWDHALYAGRQIYRDAFPKDVSVFLIEAESLALGLDISERVVEAGRMVADRIVDLIGRPATDHAVASDRAVKAVGP